MSLLDPNGRELLVNGDFAQALDRWFFSSDDHLAWHIKNLWAQVFFEQGILGLVSWTMLVITALWMATRRAVTCRNDHQSLLDAALLASIFSFLVVGLFDSLFDAPRLATLFLLLLLIALSERMGHGQLEWPQQSRRGPEYRASGHPSRTMARSGDGKSSNLEKAYCAVWILDVARFLS